MIVFQIITFFHAGFKLDSISCSPTFNIGLEDIHAIQTKLDDFFTLIKEADNPHIIVIDFFQQIWKINREKNEKALMQTIIQYRIIGFFCQKG